MSIHKTEDFKNLILESAFNKLCASKAEHDLLAQSFQHTFKGAP